MHTGTKYMKKQPAKKGKVKKFADGGKVDDVVVKIPTPSPWLDTSDGSGSPNPTEEERRKSGDPRTGSGRHRNWHY